MYYKLIASFFLTWCHAPAQHAGNLRALVLSWSCLECVSNQVIVINNQLLYFYFLKCTKLNTMEGNHLVSQPIVIIIETD